MDLCPPLLKLHTCSTGDQAPATRGRRVQPAQPNPVQPRLCPACRLCCVGICKLRSMGRGAGYLAIAIVQWLTDPFHVQARCGQMKWRCSNLQSFHLRRRAGVVSQGMRTVWDSLLSTLWGWTGTSVICCVGLLVTCWQERPPATCHQCLSFSEPKGLLEGQPLAPW